MVELRSGKHVDLGPVKKARSSNIPRPIGKTTRPLKSHKGSKLNMSLSFEIYEDDPNAPRPDLEVSPRDHWETAAIDQENEEPDDLVTTEDGWRPEDMAISGNPARYRVWSSAGVADPSYVHARPSSVRPALHQIFQDGDVKMGNSSRHKTKASKGVETAQPPKNRKSTKSDRPSEQVPSIRIHDSLPAVKRVSMLGLR